LPSTLVAIEALRAFMVLKAMQLHRLNAPQAALLTMRV